MAIYINIKNHGQVETVDEFDTMKEANAMIADKANNYYLSHRSTKDWRDK